MEFIGGRASGHSSARPGRRGSADQAVSSSAGARPKPLGPGAGSPRRAGRIQQQAGTGRQWMQQAGECPCANPTAAGSPQVRSTRRPAAVVRRPQPPGRRSHRRRPDTSGRRSRRPAERIGGAAALHRQVDVSAIAEHLGHGAAVSVDGLGAKRHHRTDRATAGGRRPLLTLRETA